MVRPLAHLRTAAAHAVRALPPSRTAFGILGGGLVAEGAREISQPAGFITAGVLVLVGVFLHARGSAAIAKPEAAPE